MKKVYVQVRLQVTFVQNPSADVKQRWWHHIYSVHTK